MKKVVAFFIVGAIFVTSAAEARKRRDGYPYDRSVTGCVKGDCTNGFGVYVYDDDDIFEGNWKDGKQHGQGVYYLVDGEPWPEAHRVAGSWVDGQQHGKLFYVFPNGATRTQYWHYGEDVTSRVDKCRSAQTLSNAYKGFVAIVNGLVAAGRGENIAEGAAWGYDAAGDQVIPRAVDLTCDQLLAEFE